MIMMMTAMMVTAMVVTMVMTIEDEDTIESYKEEAFKRVAKFGGGPEDEIDGECLRNFFAALGENVNLGGGREIRISGD